MIDDYTKIKITSEPVIEPVTVQEVRDHLRLQEEDWVDTVDTTQSVEPAKYTDGTTNGASKIVTGYRALVNINFGTTVDADIAVTINIQESADDTTWVTWNSTTYDNTDASTIVEIEYTGNQQYIRVQQVIAEATDGYNLGSTIIRQKKISYEVDLLTLYIKTAREMVEKYSSKKMITQTIEQSYDFWTDLSYMQLSFGYVQSVSSVKYYTTDGTENTFSSEKYNLDNYRNPAIIYLDDGETFPTESLRPADGVRITYVAGFGDAATDVPERYKTAIKMLAGHYYENRESTITQRQVNEIIMNFDDLLCDREVLM